LRKAGLLHDSNHTTGYPSAGRAGGLGFEIVGLGVNDYRAANDRFRPFETQNVIGYFDPGQAVLVGFDVTKITNVAHLGFWTGVGHIGWIEVAARGIRVRGAAVPVFVNMKCMGSRRQAFDIYGDSNSLVAIFGEMDDPPHLTTLGRVHNGGCLFNLDFGGFAGASHQGHAQNQGGKQRTFDDSSHVLLLFVCEMIPVKINHYFRLSKWGDEPNQARQSPVNRARQRYKKKRINGSRGLNRDPRRGENRIFELNRIKKCVTCVYQKPIEYDMGI
jgi:hypothetical protein